MKVLILLFTIFSTISYGSDFTTSDLVNEINAVRAHYDMKPVIMDEALTCAAFKLAQDIAPKNLCQNKGTDGSTLLDRALGCGTHAGAELVGCGYLDAKSVVATWTSRLDGSKIIFDPWYTKIGTSRVLNHFVIVFY